MEFGLGYIAVGLAAGLAMLGAGIGIGRIGGSVAESISRQPEAAGKIQLVLYVAAGMIEGAALFAIVIALLIALKLNGSIDKTIGSSASAPKVEQGQ
ncbi:MULTISPECIES: ATP synthase F0 subunit C [Leptospira]|uniref:ATP synthase subunit c n=2 Tax=Leptospira TaxID=171 RepID=A0A4V6QMT2_9LEPT|nr:MULTISPECIES: ATP synthase F0 subunit C [Leptospira]TGN10561.1 ATP synthase F0 subunit C [Leptospira ilyithenensis]BDA79824.1 ATP synthase subunit C [Leptospira kobayashii]